MQLLHVALMLRKHGRKDEAKFKGDFAARKILLDADAGLGRSSLVSSYDVRKMPSEISRDTTSS